MRMQMINNVSATPNESIVNGADKIIMGRSLINGDIVKNLDKVSKSIKI